MTNYFSRLCETFIVKHFILLWGFSICILSLNPQSSWNCNTPERFRHFAQAHILNLFCDFVPLTFHFKSFLVGYFKLTPAHPVVGKSEEAYYHRLSLFCVLLVLKLQPTEFRNSNVWIPQTPNNHKSTGTISNINSCLWGSQIISSSFPMKKTYCIVSFFTTTQRRDIPYGMVFLAHLLKYSSFWRLKKTIVI